MRFGVSKLERMKWYKRVRKEWRVPLFHPISPKVALLSTPLKSLGTLMAPLHIILIRGRSGPQGASFCHLYFLSFVRAKLPLSWSTFVSILEKTSSRSEQNKKREMHEVAFDSGIEEPGSVQTGRGRTSELSPHREVQAHTSLHIIYLAWRLFGVFLFILRLACLTPVWTLRSGICCRIMLQPLTAFFTFLALRVFALACAGLMQTSRARSLSITLVQNVMIK